MRKIKIGWASVSITPDRPLLMLGQMYHRVSEYVRDPITATALALDNGEAQAVFVSLDMTEPPVGLGDDLRERLRGLPGFDFDYVSLGVTHTHNSSDFDTDFLRDDNERAFGKDILPRIEMDEDVLRGEEARQFLLSRVEDLIRRAWMERSEGGISFAGDYAAVGFNRRPIFGGKEGNRTVMYGDCSGEDFIGFENGADSSLDTLYTWDLQGTLTGVAVNVPCPSQMFELHRFISADYWAFAREEIRASLGSVYILPLCGAAGDLSPIDLVRISKDNQKALAEWGGQTREVFRNFDMTRECEGIAARICDAIRRGLRQARSTIEYSPAFEHRILRLSLPLRLVTQEEYETAAAEVRRLQSVFSSENPMTMEDVVRSFETQGVVLRYGLQQQTQSFEVLSHIVRLGGTAIATNPFELFHTYALRMKARVKARQLMVIQLSNGIGGYLPTEQAIAGGSYSSKAASTFCGPQGGDMLVEETVRMVNSMF